MYTKKNRALPIVQKFGGTSLGDIGRIRRAARRIAARRARGWRKLAVVVSAMSGETNRIVSLVRQANPHASAKNFDMAVSAGEQVSVGLLSASLQALGVPAEPFLAYQIGIVTDRSHGRARIRSIRTDRLKAAWRRGAVPVIAGFQGVTDTMDITTLGRGGSDTSAVALAAALEASFCEINTDVDGVYTADPRAVPGARIIESLDYETALELAALGSKVIHARAVEVAAKYRVPIVVRSSFKPDTARSTTIMSLTDRKALESPVVSGVTLDPHIAKLTVKGRNIDAKALATVFGKVAAAGINVDIIVQDHKSGESEPGFGFTVAQADARRTRQVLKGMSRQRRYADLKISHQEGLAKVSVVGLGMRSHSGVASRAFKALTAKKIDILMISTSEIKISCVVKEQKGKSAAAALHKAFFK